MTGFFLIRHGSTDAVGQRLAGRRPGLHLDERGAREARHLASLLADVPIAAVCSSPMERARETAAPIASRQGMEVQLRAGLDEVDFGDWTGRTFDELAPLPEWRRFNRLRSCTRVPGGEHMAEIQARVVSELEQLRAAYPGERVVVVTHADIIRAALAWYAAIPIDLFLRLEISPASVSVVAIAAAGPRIACVNYTGTLPP